MVAVGGAPVASSVRSSEHLREGALHRHVDLRHRRGDAEIEQGGHPVAVVADAAGHDALEVREVAVDVEGDAVEGDPAAHADAERAADRLRAAGETVSVIGEIRTGSGQVHIAA